MLSPRMMCKPKTTCSTPACTKRNDFDMRVLSKSHEIEDVTPGQHATTLFPLLKGCQ